MKRFKVCFSWRKTNSSLTKKARSILNKLNDNGRVAFARNVDFDSLRQVFSFSVTGGGVLRVIAFDCVGCDDVSMLENGHLCLDGSIEDEAILTSRRFCFLLDRKDRASDHNLDGQLASADSN